LTALRHANGTLNVSAGPNRLIKTAHAEPEGSALYWQGSAYL
jgi:hypothetical protein